MIGIYNSYHLNNSKIKWEISEKQTNLTGKNYRALRPEPQKPQRGDIVLFVTDEQLISLRDEIDSVLKEQMVVA